MRHIIFLLGFCLISFSLHAQVAVHYACAPDTLTLTPVFEADTYLPQPGLLIGTDRDGAFTGHCRIGQANVSFKIPYHNNPTLTEVIDGRSVQVVSQGTCATNQTAALRLLVNGTEQLRIENFSHTCSDAQVHQLQLSFVGKNPSLKVCWQKPGGSLVNPPDIPVVENHYIDEHGTYTPTIRCRTLSLASATLPVTDAAFHELFNAPPTKKSRTRRD